MKRQKLTHSDSIRIQFGTGDKPLHGWVNVDVEKRFHPDVQWDMNRFPYPFRSGAAEEIFCEMTLEHIKEPSRAIDEFHRILKKGGHMKVIVPHFSHHGAHLADWHICVFNTDYFYTWKQGVKIPEGNWAPVKIKFKKLNAKIMFPKGKLTLLSLPFQIIFGKNRLMQKIYEASILKNIYSASELHVNAIK